MDAVDTPIPDLGVVIAAGGTGTRFGGGNKLLADLVGKPVFLHCLEAFLPLCPHDRMALVIPAAARAAFQAELAQRLPGGAPQLVDGGDTRSESVRNGIQALPATVVWVTVHDAARPLATAEVLAAVLAAAREHGGAIAARRVTDTLKESDAGRRIVRTVDREPLWAVETPQVFRRDQLLAAYAQLPPATTVATDDGAVMELAGHHPFLCEIRSPNPKITVPEDLSLAKALLGSR